ncbi:PTS glucose transporter subunit IIA [Vagococcus acidifermentans]|nr:PTS glucose transporter subunit IIA [Vagococcus acidifermentans]
MCQSTEGKVLDLTQINDQVFSLGMMGQDFAVIPESSKVFSPIKGKVRQIFQTKHAITLVSDNGLSVIVHIGLDTVELNGQGIDNKVTEEQIVDRNDLLANVNLEEIKRLGKETEIIVVFQELEGEVLLNIDAPEDGIVASVKYQVS